MAHCLIVRHKNTVVQVIWKQFIQINLNFCINCSMSDVAGSQIFWKKLLKMSGVWNNLQVKSGGQNRWPSVLMPHSSIEISYHIDVVVWRKNVCSHSWYSSVALWFQRVYLSAWLHQGIVGDGMNSPVNSLLWLTLGLICSLKCDTLIMPAAANCESVISVTMPENL